MYRYKIWVKLNEYQTAETIIMANNDYDAKMLAEAQYGQGMVLSYSRIYD